MYTPFTLWEDPTRLFMESDNYQPRLVLKDIKSNIDYFSILFEESTKYEVKVETFTLACGQNFIEIFSLMLASFYIFNVEYPPKIGRIANVFAKVSLGNMQWNKNTTEDSTTYIKSKKAAI